jgi:hypothetical protein
MHPLSAVDQPNVRIHPAILEEEWPADEGVLGRVVAADGAIGEGTGECVEEVGDVEGGGREAVEDADVALCVGVHGGVAGVPELLFSYEMGFG